MTSAGWFAWPREVVEVRGPDAVTFLQGQLSQDVARLAVGASAWTFVLQPQGKVAAWARATRVADDALVLDTDAGWGDALVARLQRFKLRVKADITPLPWRCIALRGAAAGQHAASSVDGVLVVPTGWPDWDGVDLLGPDVDAPADLPSLDADAFHAGRIVAGFPALGAELDDDTIPAEGGQRLIERSVSFTKGCYTGQELVARVDSRGSNTPRRLRLLRVDGALVPESGAAVVLEAGGDAVGRVTSAARSAGGVVALASLGRAVVPPVDVRVAIAGDRVAASVVALPGDER
jgi:folate-binding protein YgfZ